MAEKFGSILRNLRIDKRITLRKLSEYTGKTISYLSDVEHGRKIPPSTEVVKKIENFLNVKGRKLSELAEKTRKFPKLIKENVQNKPNLAHALLRGERDLTQEEYEKFLKQIEETVKRRENDK